MPHLSPMNWLMAISMFWLFLLTISTSHWWLQPMKFPLSSKSFNSKISSSWKWSL